MRRALLVLGLGLAGCVANIPLPTSMMAGGDETRLADLGAGRDLYIAKCAGCHRLYDVERYSDRQWITQVDEMAALKKVRLTDEDRRRLVLYLTTANGRD